jgi:hypothetical protein
MCRDRAEVRPSAVPLVSAEGFHPLPLSHRLVANAALVNFRVTFAQQLLGVPTQFATA